MQIDLEDLLGSPDSAEGRAVAPLNRSELRDIIDLSLWAGQLLLQNGAHAERVETTVHHLGTGLGCNWMDVFISANSLIITATSGVEFRTKIRRIVRLGAVNMGVVAAVNALSREVSAGKLNRFEVRARLEQIDKAPRHYPHWLTMLLAALACASFGRLFGGDAAVVAVTFVASGVGLLVRNWFLGRQFNQFLAIVGAAFVTTLVGSTAVWLRLGAQPSIALAAGVLFLVPGVALVNAVEDLLSGHTLMGVARGLSGALVSLGIALGIAMSLALAGLNDLWPQLTPLPTFWEHALWTAVAATGFAVLFNVPRSAVWGATLCAVVGGGLRYLLMRTGWDPLSDIEPATLIGAVVIGFLGQTLAHRQKLPAMTFTVSGIIPMVPGTYAFGAMIGLLEVSRSTVQTAGPLLVQVAVNIIVTALILIALATGITLPALLFRRARPVA